MFAEGRAEALGGRLEAAALTYAERQRLSAWRSPLLRLQGDERLVALLREGNESAFDAIVHRYRSRLLGFCRQMLGSTEDAEDALQEIFVNAYRALLADEREILLRPWLYRIARNRCLNHLRGRRPAAAGADALEFVPTVDAASTHERVHNREEFRRLLGDVQALPETQRTALLLREMDDLSYEEIGEVMDASVASVRSLLIRARTTLAEASQARGLTCGEVRVELVEASQGLRKVSAPVRRHVRECEGCGELRTELRGEARGAAALTPVGALVAFKEFVVSKLGIGGAAVSGGAGGVAGGLGAAGGVVASKAVAGAVAAAIVATGAFELKRADAPNRAVNVPAPELFAPPRPAGPVSVVPPGGIASEPAAAPAAPSEETVPPQTLPEEEFPAPTGTGGAEGAQDWEPTASEAAAIGVAGEDAEESTVTEPVPGASTTPPEETAP